MFDLPKTKEIQQFEDQFSAEMQELLALTGSNGVGGARLPSEQYWTASIELAAWKDPAAGELRQSGGQLTVQADDDGLEQLQEAMSKDSVIRAVVRRAQDGSPRFLLVDMPSSAADGELEAVLAERLKPMYYDDPVLGRFTLNRSVRWFERGIDWMGKTVGLSFDWDEEDKMADALRTARTLAADQQEWHRRLLARASQDLLDLKNDIWLEEEEEELTAAAFESRMELESVEVRPEGEFCFWFRDGNLFWGHSITVEGTVNKGPLQADLQG